MAKNVGVPRGVGRIGVDLGPGERLAIGVEDAAADRERFLRSRLLDGSSARRQRPARRGGRQRTGPDRRPGPVRPGPGAPATRLVATSTVDDVRHGPDLSGEQAPDDRPARRAAAAETAVPRGRPAATRARASTQPGGTAAVARDAIAAARAALGHGDAAPGQPGVEQAAGVGQAAAEGRLAPAQLEGGLRVGLALQVAEHDRLAEPLGQPRELLVQRDAPIVVRRGLTGRDECRTGRPRRARDDPSASGRGRPATATRCATRCSQPPTASRPRIVPALRIRTRNVAWNASSTSGEPCSTEWQTPRTIGPCRITSAANADSSRRAR